jgi:hypothetical protein
MTAILDLDWTPSTPTKHVLREAPCSVAILVDRGLGGHAQAQVPRSTSGRASPRRLCVPSPAASQGARPAAHGCQPAHGALRRHQAEHALEHTGFVSASLSNCSSPSEAADGNHAAARAHLAVLNIAREPSRGRGTEAGGHGGAHPADSDATWSALLACHVSKRGIFV